MNGLDLLTSFKSGDIDIEQCVCRRIISWKITLPVMQCWMSLTMVITSIQASLNGSPESQVIKLLSPIDFAGVLMKTNKQKFQTNPTVKKPLNSTNLREKNH